MNWLEYLDWGEEELKDLRFAGYSYFMQGKYDIALSFFNTLLILEPENVFDLKAKAAIFLEVNKPIDALTYLDRALKKSPKDIEILINRAKALLSLGHIKQGLKIAKSLVDIKDETIKNEAEALILSFS